SNAGESGRARAEGLALKARPAHGYIGSPALQRTGTRPSRAELPGQGTVRGRGPATTAAPTTTPAHARCTWHSSIYRETPPGAKTTAVPQNRCPMQSRPVEGRSTAGARC